MNLLKSTVMTWVLLFFACATSIAQSKWGIKGGLNSHSLTEDEFVFTDVPSFERIRLKLSGADYGFQLGFVYHFELTKRLFLQPEILFNSSNYQYKLQDFTNGNVVEIVLNEKYQFMDFPIQVGLSPHPFQFGVGVVPQIFIGADSELSDINGIQQSFDDASFAWTASAGLDVLKTLKFEIRYENSEELLGRTILVDTERYDFESRTEQWILSVSIMF